MALHWRRTQEQSQLTRRQILFILGELFVAGSDTTSNSVAFSIFLLATHPAAEARLVEEIRRLRKGSPPDSVENLDKYQYCLMVTEGEQSCNFQYGLMVRERGRSTIPGQY